MATSLIQAIGRPQVLTTVGYATAVLAALSSLSWTLGYDQSIFSWVGQVIVRGGLPYKDAWDMRGPLTHYLYASALAVWGDPEVSIRILDLIIVAGFSWVLRKFTLQINGSNVFGANCAVIFFLLSYYGFGFWHTAEPDGWGGMLILIAVGLMLNERWRPNRILIAVGILIGLATLLKPTFVAFLALPLLNPIGQSPSLRAHIQQVAICSLAFSTTIGIWIAVLLALGVRLDDLLDVLRFIFTAYSRVRNHLSQVPERPLFLVWLIPFVCASIGVWTLARIRGYRQAAIIGTCFALSAALVFVQGKFWPYHWQPAIIAMSPGLGILFSESARRWCVEDASSTKAMLIVSLFALVMVPLGIRLFLHAQRTMEPSRLSAYMIAHSLPGDAVLAMCDFRLNVLSERRSPTRFATCIPLSLPGTLREKYREAFLAEIHETPPVLILVYTGVLATKSPTAFPGFAQFVTSRYAHVDDIDKVEIWKAR